jgi:hypothetical protein
VIVSSGAERVTPELEPITLKAGAVQPRDVTLSNAQLITLNLRSEFDGRQRTLTKKKKSARAARPSRKRK